MNKIYHIISKLSSKFKEMAYGLTNDEETINDSVQELMLYFLTINPQVLINIYEKDGEEGLIRYGAVALRRSLTSPRSAYYYKYRKYYTNISSHYTTTVTQENPHKSIYNIPETIEVNYDFEKLDKIDAELEKLYWYDSKVFQLYYYEGNTLDSLAKKTGISRNSLFSTIDRVREILKKELNE